MDRPDFSPTWVRVGYAREPVDETVERILRRDPTMTAAAVADLAFPARMYRPGYDMGEVDDWLDEVQVALGGRPSEALAPATDVRMPAPAEPSQASSDRVRAALIIAVTLAATVWIYVSRF